MGILHAILNLAGVLLWLNWQARSLTSSIRPTGATLISTLKRAEPTHGLRWMSLAGLILLLGLRAVLYWQLGSAINWTPSLSFGAVAIHFRSDLLARMLLFSLLSFIQALLVLYGWLFLLSAVNQSVAEVEPFQSLVRTYLGWFDRWPAWLKFLLPGLLSGMLWLGYAPLLARLNLHFPPVSATHLIQQAGVIGLAGFLPWKYLVVGVLLMHLLNSYVYVGNAPFWNYVNLTARHLVAPFHWLPLRFGRVDFSAVFAIALVFLLAETGERWLPELFSRLPW